MERDDFAGAALRRRAVESPEEPFLFFRDERGHVGWWSWARAARELDAASPGPTAGVAREWLVDKLQG